jgi:hypothetical protein
VEARRGQADQAEDCRELHAAPGVLDRGQEPGLGLAGRHSLALEAHPERPQHHEQQAHDDLQQAEPGFEAHDPGL